MLIIEEHLQWVGKQKEIHTRQAPVAQAWNPSCLKG
jgi:hypothetical protein